MTDRVVVVGAGTMGHGIAQVCAQYGYCVTLVDVKQEILERAVEGIKSNLNVMRSLGVINVSDAEVLSRISLETDLEKACTKARLVIEAIVENLKAKHDLFYEMDKWLPEDCIVTSNTSSLSITAMARSMGRTEKFVGMHWFTPPHLIPVVEVVKTEWVAPEAVRFVVDFVKSVKKYPVVCKDSPGFIVNRVLQAMGLEAFSILEEGLVEDQEQLDRAISLTFGIRMPFYGPCRLADFGGLDIWLATARNLFEQLKHEKFRPPKVLENKVKDGLLGVKNGNGFYEYSEEERKRVVEERNANLIKCLQMLGWV